MTIDQVCTCAIDRYLRSATVAQIREDSTAPAPARISAATAQCVTELVTAAQANQPAQSNGPAPAADAAPAATDAAPAEAPAEGEGETENAAH